MKIVSDDEFELSTGKRLYAHALIIGLDVRLDSSRPVYYGYDGDVDWPLPDWWSQEEKNEAAIHYLTDAEMAEVADYMIEKWKKLRQKCTEEK